MSDTKILSRQIEKSENEIFLFFFDFSADGTSKGAVPAGQSKQNMPEMHRGVVRRLKIWYTIRIPE